MRMVRPEDGRPPRDCLSQAWSSFLAAALPGVPLIPLPNTGRAVMSTVQSLGLTGFILTGGNDLGSEPTRDETEKALLAHAVDNGLPVLGVCRGAQVINNFFSGSLQPADAARHVAVRHPITATGPALPEAWSREVNSFHNWMIPENGLGKGLVPRALCPDNGAEAFTHETHLLLALMWHPERETPPDPTDVSLVRELFGFGGKA